MNRRQIVTLVLLLPFVPWLLAAGNFFYPRFSEYSDLTISHLPNALQLLRALRDSGQIPMWSNAILGGYPFSANPLAGLWYMPGWLAYLLPQPFGFNGVVILHIFWGGYGMLTLLRAYGLKESSALLGALSFLLMPKLFAHFGAGHVTLVYAFAWTPWLLVAEQARLKRGLWWLPAGVLGLIALADVRWLAYALVLWVGYSVCAFCKQSQIERQWGNVAGWFLRSGGVVIWSLLLALVLLFPLFEFTQLSTRAWMSSSDSLQYSLPFEELLGLWIPDFGGFAEWTLYPGSLVFYLIIYCLSIPDVRRKCAFWLIVLAGGILLSLGERLPLMNLVAQLPGFDLLRVPTRFYFLSGLALCIIAAYALDDLLKRDTLHRPDAIFFMTPFGAFVFFLGVGILIMGGTLAANLIWAAGGFLISIVILSLAQRVRRSLRWIEFVFPLFLVLDLSGVNAQSLSIWSSDVIFDQGEPAASFVASQPGDFRIYTPSNSIPQHKAASMGIRMANGIDPLQLQTYWEYMRTASGVPESGYSVTLPPLEGKDVRLANRKAIPDADKLGLLSVRYIVSEFPLSVDGLNLVFQDGDTRVYENDKFVPWVRITDQNGAVKPEFPTYISKPGYYKIQVNEAGLLTVADVDYPGWEVYIDGKPAKKILVANLLVGVNVPRGAQQVEFIFRSESLILGTIVSITAWLGWMAVMVFSWMSFLKRKLNSRGA